MKSNNIAIKEPFLKRPFDIFLSLVGLIIFLPLWSLISLAIYLEDRNPIFFSLMLPGRNDKLFYWLKFRTMKRPTMETLRHQIVNLQGDPRVTEVGKILRASAMDELPQLLNILKGDMSFVGPRPMDHADARPQYKSLYDVPGYNLRSQVRPGLTGLAQLYLTKYTTLRNKFHYDNLYIRKMSFCLDLKIILLSFWVTLKGSWEREGPKVGKKRKKIDRKKTKPELNKTKKTLLVKLESIKDGWNQGATKDVITYILGSKCERKLDLKAFFDLKSRQAEEDTAGFFHEMHFIPTGKRMLDIGCGIGAMTSYFSQIFAEAHGVDISEEMIKKALEVNKENDHLFFRTNNGLDLLIYEDNFFDFCFSFATFQYFPSKMVIENCFKEIARVLKPQGLFKIQLDGRKWVSSRSSLPIYRPVYNFLRNSYFLTLFGRLITDGITVKAYRGMAISWKTVVNILQPLPLEDIKITGKNTSQMWVSGRKN